MMAELLELPQLVEEHGMPEVKIGGSGVEARLHAQWRARTQLILELGLQKQLVRAAADHVELRFYGGHMSLTKPGCGTPGRASCLICSFC